MPTLRCCLMMSFSVPALTACSSGAPPASSGHLNQQQSVESGSEAGMERFKKEVEQLAAIRFDDPEAVGRQLKTQLGAATRDNVHEERSAERGMLGDLSILNIKLRSASDNPAHATLTFDIAPPSVVVGNVLWEDSIPYPARPDASGSRPYWSTRVSGSEVILGLESDGTTLNYISISQR